MSGGITEGHTCNGVFIFGHLCERIKQKLLYLDKIGRQCDHITQSEIVKAPMYSPYMHMKSKVIH